jgi:hypothetical protein
MLDYCASALKNQSGKQKSLLNTAGNTGLTRDQQSSKFPASTFFMKLFGLFMLAAFFSVVGFFSAA